VTEIHPDELPLPKEIDDIEQARFEQGCFRIAALYILVYLIIGIAVTVLSVATGTHWWVLGWGWPHILILTIIIGISLGAWGDKQ
jgi:fatty acid desaturase